MLAIVIPCYNEANSITELVELCKQYTDLVIVCDDESKDNTVYLAHEAGATVIGSYNENHGAGINTKRGMNYALKQGADIIVTLDGDGQHNPLEIPQLIQPILNNEADLVIGSRYKSFQVPLYRRFGISVITYLYNILNKVKVSDSQSGFRAYSKKVLEVFPITEDGFEFSIETLVKIRKSGFRIKEVPINCIYHEDFKLNSSMNPIKHGIKVVLSVLKWRMKVEVSELAKSIPFKAIRIVTKPLIGSGLGRISFLRNSYNSLTKRLMPENEKVVQLENFKVRINTSERGLDGMSNVLFTTKNYEPVTTSVFKKVLRKGMYVVDIGANIGYYSLLSSKIVGNYGKVWAVEPEPHNIKGLKANIELNNADNIKIIDKAISDKNSTARFYVSKEESGEHSLLKGRPNVKDFIEVQTIRLDDLIKDNVDFIKTDTEGNEYNVLKGAERLLKFNPNITLITEIWCPGIKASGHSPIDIWNLLESYGFKYFAVLDEIGKDIVNGNVESTYIQAMYRCKGDKYSVNLVCSKKEIELC